MLQRDCASILQETLGLSGFSSCGTWAQRLCSMWDLPAPGIEPMSPALTGRFFITEPLGKPKGWVLSQLFYSLLSSSSRGSLNPLHFAIRVVSSAYLKVLIFLLAIFIPIRFIQPHMSQCTVHRWYFVYEVWMSLFVSDYLQLMDFTVHGILQATILEWEAVPFSRGSSQPRDWTQVSWFARGFFTIWATRKAWKSIVKWD